MVYGADDAHQQRSVRGLRDQQVVSYEDAVVSGGPSNIEARYLTVT
jgi:hypothetical protein